MDLSLYFYITCNMIFGRTFIFHHGIVSKFRQENKILNSHLTHIVNFRIEQHIGSVDIGQ